MILLKSIKPFAQGGNRLCFVHPENPGLCIKVRRPDFTLEDRRRKKGFPKNLRPLSSFDDNREEEIVMRKLERHLGIEVFRHISRSYGFVDTDMGKGLVSELIRDESGVISQTLKKNIWDDGLSSEIEGAIETLCRFWLLKRVPSRDLLLHNIVVQRDKKGIARLVVVDGLGTAGIVSFRWLPDCLKIRKTQKKIDNLHQRVETLLSQRGGDDFPGYHGLLLHDDSL